MKVDVLLGLQWGDEGKGKVVDVLTPNYDVVARFQGGPNAGHTLEFEGQKYVLRSIPSGIFQNHSAAENLFLLSVFCLRWFPPFSPPSRRGNPANSYRDMTNLYGSALFLPPFFFPGLLAANSSRSTGFL